MDKAGPNRNCNEGAFRCKCNKLFYPRIVDFDVTTTRIRFRVNWEKRVVGRTELC